MSRFGRGPAFGTLKSGRRAGLLSIPTGDSYGGWGFTDSPTYQDIEDQGNGGQVRRRWGPEKANLIDDESLRILPFFGQFQEEDNSFFLPDVDDQEFRFRGDDLYGPIGASGIQDLDPDGKKFYMIRAKLLAEAIPAVSKATGANDVTIFGNASNYDMPAVFREKDGVVPLWPMERGNDKDWRHGDMHRVALMYLYSLYAEVLDRAEI